MCFFTFVSYKYFRTQEAFQMRGETSFCYWSSLQLRLLSRLRWLGQPENFRRHVVIFLRLLLSNSLNSSQTIFVFYHMHKVPCCSHCHLLFRGGIWYEITMLRAKSVILSARHISLGFTCVSDDIVIRCFQRAAFWNIRQIPGTTVFKKNKHIFFQFLLKFCAAVI